MSKIAPRILVTGASGQLAQALRRVAAEKSVVIHVLGRPGFDFAEVPSMRKALEGSRPSVVINAAAFTSVDQAELEREQSEICNSIGVKALAEQCRELKIALVHVSTDYVFDGNLGRAYLESDRPAPLNQYGASKLRGELAFAQSGVRGVVVRTAWLFSDLGVNFLTRVLSQARVQNELRYVSDQVGSPTCAYDLAEVLLAFAEKLAAGWTPTGGGIFHAAGDSSASAFDFALACVRLANEEFRMDAHVVPVRTADRPVIAQRPADSRLCSDQLAAILGLRLRPWQTWLPSLISRALSDPRM